MDRAAARGGGCHHGDIVNRGFRGYPSREPADAIRASGRQRRDRDTRHRRRAPRDAARGRLQGLHPLALEEHTDGRRGKQRGG